MRVVLSPLFDSDLEEIADYIAKDNPMRAKTFASELRGLVHKIGRNPFAYQLRPEIAPNIRVAVHKRHVILFTVSDDVVRIERATHGGRSLNPLMRRD